MKHQTQNYKIDEDYSINVATQEDSLDEITDLVSLAISETPYNTQEYDQDQLRFVLDKYRHGPSDQSTMLLLRNNETLVGILIGIKTDNQSFLHLKAQAFELLWYVKKDHRKGSPADTLRKAYETWAKMAGCTKATMGDFEGRLSSYYKRKGYRLVESTYIKELE